MTARHVEWVAIAFFATLVAIVFQQIATSMTEQGIASGGPYDNAASYPRNIAIFVMGLLAVQIALSVFQRSPGAPDDTTPDGLRRAIALLVVFAIYLLGLDWLGYHLTTTPMAVAVMWICGGRNLPKLFVTALGMAFVLAFAFEKILNVVLPGGIFRLNIPW